MNNIQFKRYLLSKLQSRGEYFQRVSDEQFRTRCPFCGDSQKHLLTGHLYLKINLQDNSPIVYYCHKCPAHGILDYEALEAFGITGENLKEEINQFNSKADRVKNSSTYNRQDKFFDYRIPNIFHSGKVEYLERRLGCKFSDDDLIKMKVVTSLKDFLYENNLRSITCKPEFARYLEERYIGFLSNKNSHIIFRDTSEQSKIRWYKYPITEESIGQRIFYSMASDIDLFTKEDITINLAEGIMDVISIHKNLEYYVKDNILNIAVCGKYYFNIIKYLFQLGFIGQNITINIFADNDHTEDTSFEYYQRTLKNYSFFVNKIVVHHNSLSKDCGVPKSQILLTAKQI